VRFPATPELSKPTGLTSYTGAPVGGAVPFWPWVNAPSPTWPWLLDAPSVAWSKFDAVCGPGCVANMLKGCAVGEGGCVFCKPRRPPIRSISDSLANRGG